MVTTKGVGTAETATIKRTTAKRATTWKPTPRSISEDAVRRDLASLVGDVRTALDEFAVKGDLATMQGRDHLQKQVEVVEARWLKVKHELGQAKTETDATVDSLRAGITKAEEAVRHLVDAVRVGIRKP